MATITAEARSPQGPGLPATPSREDRLEAAHGVLLEGIAQLTTSEAWARMLSVAARFHSYSAGNCLLILAQRPDATRVAGLLLWNSLGRRVNRGEHGIKIFVPITRKHTDDVTGDDERRICGFSVGTVFSEDQTSGDDLDPVAPRLLTGAAPEGLIERVCALIESEGFTVSFGDCGRANGLTNWTTRTVTIRDDLEPAAQFKTICHEAGHVVAHSPEIGTEVTCRGIKEVEAESIAFIVSATLGLDTSEYTFPYVAHWATGIGELAAIQATAERVITFARKILNGLDT
jgi:antirestriction protein ArdC